MAEGLDEEYGPPSGNFDTPADRLTQRIADAMNRNGLNAHLLDIQIALGVISSDMRHVAERQVNFQDEVRRRLDGADASRRELHDKVNTTIAETATLRSTLNRIAPMVDAHERENVERAALRRAISAWMGRGKLIYGAIVAAVAAVAGWVAGHFPSLTAWFTGHNPPH